MKGDKCSICERDFLKSEDRYIILWGRGDDYPETCREIAHVCVKCMLVRSFSFWG